MGIFDFFVTVFPILFVLIFILVFGVILFVIIRGLTRWDKNNRSPVLTVEAAVAAKRIFVGRHMANNMSGHGHHIHSRTEYFAAFQVESGDRFELALNGEEYGLLREGDTGRLTFQGTRYLGFERDGQPRQNLGSGQ